MITNEHSRDSSLESTTYHSDISAAARSKTQLLKLFKISFLFIRRISRQQRTGNEFSGENIVHLAKLLGYFWGCERLSIKSADLSQHLLTLPLSFSFFKSDKIDQNFFGTACLESGELLSVNNYAFSIRHFCEDCSESLVIEVDAPKCDSFCVVLKRPDTSPVFSSRDRLLLDVVLRSCEALLNESFYTEKNDFSCSVGMTSCFEMLNDVSEIASGDQEFEQMADSVTHILTAYDSINHASVWLPMDVNAAVQCVASSGQTEFSINGPEFREFVEKVLQQQSARIGDISHLHTSKRVPEEHHYLGIPMKIQGQVIGVLLIQRSDSTTSIGVQHALSVIAQFVAMRLQLCEFAQQLRSNIEMLEKNVRERTTALEKANRFLQLQIEERKKVEQQLTYEAHHDALTGLPNRKYLLENIHRALLEFRRDKNCPFALLFIDLDRFKTINDTLGHIVGDEFLIEVTNRIANCVREHDLLSRLGGDEFVILVEHVEVERIAESIALRIIQELKEPFFLDGQDVYSGASIGIAMSNERYVEPDEILRDADAAMYRAKASGRGRYVVFTDQIRERLVDEMILDQSIHSGIDNHEFLPQITYIFEPHTHKQIGMKVDVCWHHPELGPLGREHFAPLAESVGVMLDIERQLLTDLCTSLVKKAFAPESQLISISLSSLWLEQNNALEEILKLPENYGLPANAFCFSFSEEGVLDELEVCCDVLERIHMAGCKVSINHFGSQVGALGLLARCPVDYVEIDDEFSQTLTISHKNRTLLKAICQLSQHFRFQIILRGVDASALESVVLKNGIHFVQGDIQSQDISRRKTAVI